MELRIRELAPQRDNALIRAGRPTNGLHEAVRIALLGSAKSQRVLDPKFYKLISSYTQDWLSSQLTAGDMEDLLAVLHALSRGWTPGE